MSGSPPKSAEGPLADDPSFQVFCHEIKQYYRKKALHEAKCKAWQKQGGVLECVYCHKKKAMQQQQQQSNIMDVFRKDITTSSLHEFLVVRCLADNENCESRNIKIETIGEIYVPNYEDANESIRKLREQIQQLQLDLLFGYKTPAEIANEKKDLEENKEFYENMVIKIIQKETKYQTRLVAHQQQVEQAMKQHEEILDACRKNINPTRLGGGGGGGSTSNSRTYFAEWEPLIQLDNQNRSIHIDYQNARFPTQEMTRVHTQNRMSYILQQFCDDFHLREYYRDPRSLT